MEDKQQRIRELFVKLAEGTATPEERRALLDYLEGSPLPEDLPLADELRPRADWPLMPDDASERIRTHILSHPQPARPARIRRMQWWKAAAIALPLAAVAAWMWRERAAESDFTEHVNLTRTVKTIRLADGSEVSLNRNARLTVRKDGGREAWLEGEAFFTITAHPGRPFVVHTQHQLDVTVLGTSFNVKSGENATEVVLNTGKVKVGKGESEVILRPGEMAVYDTQARQMSRSAADTLLHTSWKNELLPFRETPLKEVMGMIEERFGYTVVFSDTAAEKLLFTGYLSTRDLRQTIHTLEETFSINIRQENSRLHVNKH